MANALALLNKELGAIAKKYKGYKTANTTDSVLIAFNHPFNALAFCLSAQQGTNALLKLLLLTLVQR